MKRLMKVLFNSGFNSMLSQIIADMYQILTCNYTTWDTDEFGEYHSTTKVAAYVDYAYPTGDGIETREDWIYRANTMIGLFLGIVWSQVQADWHSFIIKTMNRISQETLIYFADGLCEMAYDVQPGDDVNTSSFSSSSIPGSIGTWLYKFVDWDLVDYAWINERKEDWAQGVF